MKNRHILKDSNLSVSELAEVINLALAIKGRRIDFSRLLEGYSIGLFFEKPSLRTRVSSQTACSILGANSVILRGDELHLHRGEMPEDSARVLSGYIDLLMGRVLDSTLLDRFASVDSIPIVNGLCNKFHPLQSFADIMTIHECFYGRIKNKNLVYIGDGNNVANSLVLSGAMSGLNVTVCTPDMYRCDHAVIQEGEKIAASNDCLVDETSDIIESVKTADIIYSDVWISMGEDDSIKADKLEQLKSFQINSELLSKAPKECIIMHCLPAHFGEEITREAFDSDQSRIFQQAHNRLPIAAAVFLFCLRREKFNEITSSIRNF